MEFTSIEKAIILNEGTLMIHLHEIQRFLMSLNISERIYIDTNLSLFHWLLTGLVIWNMHCNSLMPITFVTPSKKLASLSVPLRNIIIN